MSESHRRIPTLTAKDVDRFHRFVRTANGDECWTWTGALFDNGYGAFTIRHVTYRASRVAYFIATGVDPGAMEVCHKCDHPACVRASHLFLGTRKENFHDAMNKGRRDNCKGDQHYLRRIPGLRTGEKNGRALVTPEMVRTIRAEYVPRKVSQKSLAEKYGLSRSAVKHIVLRKNWLHV